MIVLRRDFSGFTSMLLQPGVGHFRNSEWCERGRAAEGSQHEPQPSLSQSPVTIGQRKGKTHPLRPRARMNEVGAAGASATVQAQTFLDAHGVQLLQTSHTGKGRFEMSIMPEGGWKTRPMQDAQQRPDYPPQSSYTPRSSYLTCKICDHGTLYSKTVFRMSGPVVPLASFSCPSIIGMLFSGLMVFGGQRAH